MVTALLFLALGALIVAAVFFVRAGGLSAELSQIAAQHQATQAELGALKESTQQKILKDKTRGGDVEELREKQKDLRRRLSEAQEQAKKLKAQEEARLDSEREARAETEHARAEAAEISQQMKALRLELEQLRSRKPAPRPEVAPVPAPAPVVKPAPEIADVESKLKERETFVELLEAKVKSEQRKALEAAKDLERLRTKGSTADKLYIVQKGELELWKDRYRTLEQRLNRTLREVDALHRGVLSLERRLPQTSVEEARAEAHAQTAAAVSAQIAEVAAGEAAAPAAATPPSVAGEAVPPPPPADA